MKLIKKIYYKFFHKFYPGRVMVFINIFFLLITIVLNLKDISTYFFLTDVILICDKVFYNSRYRTLFVKFKYRCFIHIKHAVIYKIYITISLFIILNLCAFIIILIIIKAHKLYNSLLNNITDVNKENLIKNLKEYYPSVLFTFFLFGLIIWLRLIRERLPMDLNQTFEFGIQTIIYLLLSIYFFIVFIFYLNRYYNINNSSNLLFKLHNRLAEYRCYIFFITHIIKGPENTFNVFWFNIICPQIYNSMKMFVVPCLHKREKYIYFFLCFLKLAIGITFFIEIILIKKVYFFYKIIPLYLIPLIFDIIIYILKEDSQRNLRFISYMVDLDWSSDEKNFFILSPQQYNFQISDHVPTTIHLEMHRCYFELQMVKKKYDKYFIPLNCFLYFISFLSLFFIFF